MRRPNPSFASLATRVLVLTALAVACSPASAPEGAANRSSPIEIPKGPLPDGDRALAHALVESHGALLLDVRSPGEFAGGHVEGAISMPHDQIESRIAELRQLSGGDFARPIVVYCRSGGRAGVAKRMLQNHGFTRVTNLGGRSDW